MFYEEPVPEGRKTKVWAVANSNSGYTIGTVRWYGPWRRYALFPEAETVWTPECLEEVTRHIDAAMDARKGVSR